MQALPSPTTKYTFSLCVLMQGLPELGTRGGRASVGVTFASALPYPFTEGFLVESQDYRVEDSVLLTLLKVDLSSTFSSSMAMRLVIRPVRVS